MYTYGMRLRPPDIGCVPKEGLIEVNFNEIEAAGRRYWGTASYGRELTAEEKEYYDMDEIMEE